MKKITTLALMLITVILGVNITSSTSYAQHKQTKKQILKEYYEMVAKVAKDDADGQYDMAVWCLANGLESKAKIHLKRVIRIDPNHAEAHKKLHHVFYKGKWMSKSELKKVKDEELANERKEKGLVKYKGEWVLKADLDKIKAGLVKIDGVWYTASDAKKIKAGWARHPETWEWIKKSDLPKAQKGLFPIDGKWLPLKKADQYHSDWSHPWMLTTKHYVIHTNLSWEEAKLKKNQVEIIYERIKTLLLGVEPPLDNRMHVYIFATQSDFNAYGADNGTGYDSVSGGWFSPVDELKPAICLWDKDFGKINLPHALAFQYQIFVLASVKLEKNPAWFICGVNTYCDRFYDAESLRKWGADNIVRAGGVANYGKSWFKRFVVSADDVRASQKNLKDAGFLICYVLHGNDKKARNYWEAFWKAVKEKAKPRVMLKLQYLLMKHVNKQNKKIRTYFQQILTGS